MLGKNTAEGRREGRRPTDVPIRVEAMEPRQLLALLTVVNVNDSGDGSLRQAILDANATAETDTIAFNIPGTGIATITPGSALPTITNPLTIDGFTQPGASANTAPLSNNMVVKIELDGKAAGGTADGLRIASGGVTVRGLSIGRFGRSGIHLQAPGALIQGNLVGLDAVGSTVRANGRDGVEVENVANTTIGGAAPQTRNVISGNIGDGISISGAGATGTFIQNNYIGTGHNVFQLLGNAGHGVGIDGGSGTRIGGPTSDLANFIKANGGAGVRVVNGTGNSVLANVITLNARLGIDIGPEGVTANDTLDPDVGANLLQNFPFIVSAVTGTTGTVLQYSLNSLANTTFRIDFFATSEGQRDPSNFGQGEFYLGFTQVTTNGFGNASVLANFGFSVPVGAYVTATATDPNGNSSEFGPDRRATSSVTTTADLKLEMTAAPNPVTAGNLLTYNLTLRNLGPDEAAGTNVGITFPDGVEFVSATPSQGTVSPSGNDVQINFGTVAANGTVTAVVTVRPTQPGPLSAVATASSLANDPSPADATVTVNTTVSNVPGALGFSGSSYTVNESAGVATITVNRTSGTLGAVAVNYATSDGTGVAGRDYTAVSGTLNFADGQTSATFTVPILRVPGFNGLRTVNLTLANPTGGASLAPQSTAVLTIQDINNSQGDYDGDGKADLAVFGPVTARWDIKPSGGGADRIFNFGAVGLLDIPIQGDYDGDGKTDVAVFRTSTAQWLILLSAGGVRDIQFGAANLFDIPVPADYDGDGKADLAVFRPSTAQWLIAYSSGGNLVTQFGATNLTDIPVPADYDGDGMADLAVFRYATAQWLIVQTTAGAKSVNFGAPNLTDLPIPADYDGDGKADLAVFRLLNAQWLIVNSGGGVQSPTFGRTNLQDFPLPGPSGALASFARQPRTSAASISAPVLGLPVPAGTMSLTSQESKKTKVRGANKLTAAEQVHLLEQWAAGRRPRLADPGKHG